MFNIGDRVRCYGRVGTVQSYHVESVKDQLLYEVVFDDFCFPYMVHEKEIEKITEPINNASKFFTNYTKFYNDIYNNRPNRYDPVNCRCSVAINPGKLIFNEIKEEHKMSRNWIKKVIFNNPATIILWKNGDKTVVKCGEHDAYDPEKGLAMAIAKYACGNQGNYYDIFKKYLPEDYKKPETDDEKDCNNCKYANLFINDYPCCKCVSHGVPQLSEWKPADGVKDNCYKKPETKDNINDKNCMNCLFEENLLSEQPCFSCSDYKNWESKLPNYDVKDNG